MLYEVLKLGGGAINVDVAASVTRDGLTYTSGTLVKLSDVAGLPGYGVYELQGADGRPGVDVAGQPVGQTIGYRLTATDAYRQDFAAADCRGA